MYNLWHLLRNIICLAAQASLQRDTFTFSLEGKGSWKKINLTYLPIQNYQTDINSSSIKGKNNRNRFLEIYIVIYFIHIHKYIWLIEPWKTWPWKRVNASTENSSFVMFSSKAFLHLAIHKIVLYPPPYLPYLHTHISNTEWIDR